MNEHMRQIADRIRTQDNRATADPIFIVQERHRIYGLDPDYSRDYVWIDGESEADEDEVIELEMKDQTGQDTPGWHKTGYCDEWRFVTACFTEQGCQHYIAANGHNLTEPRIYAASAYRNDEFIAVRKWLTEGA